MAVLAALLAILMPVAQATWPASASPETVLAPDAEAHWVPFELTPHNQIRFAMTLNGHAASALLDTGLSDTVASIEFGEVAGLRPTVASQAEAIGGRVAIRWAASGQIEIGGLKRLGGRVALADLSALGGGTHSVDMLVGSDILSCCALEIDYDSRRFRILPTGRLPFRGKAAPLRLARETSTYVTELTLGGQRLRPLLVDTGDGSAVTLRRAAWSTTGLHAAALTSTIAFGLGGAIETDVSIVPALRVGGIDVGEVEVRIESDDGFSARIGAAGRIGSGLLLRYRVLLDPRAGRMVFAPGALVDVSPLRSTSGLLLAYEHGRLRVLHVMRNSPAAASGWTGGELICEADGRAIREAVTSEGLVDWAVGTPGRQLTLRLCDGSERRLTLQRFY